MRVSVPEADITGGSLKTTDLVSAVYSLNMLHLHQNHQRHTQTEIGKTCEAKFKISKEHLLHTRYDCAAAGFGFKSTFHRLGFWSFPCALKKP